MRIPIADFCRMMSFDVVKYRCCIEIEFSLDGDDKYRACWMGKTTTPEHREVYWYGLVKDGSEAHSFSSLQEMLDAPVFHGKSIVDVWDRVVLHAIDGCDVESRLRDYLGEEPGPTRGPAADV